jgi:hypothetical protein
MQVKTQPFKEALEIKSDGICFDVYGNGAKRLGDLAVTKAGLVWSKTAPGKPMRNQGINVRWEEFINWVQTRRAAGSNGVVKLSPNNGKQQAKTAPKSGASQKLASKTTASSKLGAKFGSTLKIGGKTTSAPKIASKTLSSLKAAPKSASPVKLALKPSASSAKPGSKTASSAKPTLPGSGLAKFSQRNGTAVKLPTTRLPQSSKAKGKSTPAAAKKLAAAKVSDFARRKAN